MIITKHTTDAEILVPVRNARGRLAAALEDPDQESISLMGFLVTIAEQEGRATARKITRNALAEAGTKGNVNAALLNGLMAGPDDTYTGRRNDIRRAFFDGFHREAFKIMQGW